MFFSKSQNNKKIFITSTILSSRIRTVKYFTQNKIFFILYLKKIKKADSVGRICLYFFLRLFENPIPKHDEYHQGNCENDHGFKFL